MHVVWLLFGLLLSWSALSWGQPAQLINGNRTHAGATNYGVTTGTGSAYILTLNAAIPGYVDGSCYLMEAHVANTGAASLNVNARGARVLKKQVAGALVDLEAGDIIAGQLVEACTDGTVMQTTLGGPPSGGGSGGHIIQEEGVALTQRPALNFTGTLLTCSDDAANSRTVCALTGAGTGTLTHIGSCTGPQCFTTTAPSTTQWWSTSVAPATPSTDQVVLYIDSTSKNLSAKNDVGTITHGVQTKTQVPHEYLVSIAATGAVASARPTLANLADAADVVTLVGAQRLSNKQVNPREVLLAGTNVTPDLDQGHIFVMNAFTGNLTINCPVGTAGNPVPGHEIEFRFLSATPRTLTWNACYAAEYDLAIPTVTRGDGAIYDRIKFAYNTNSTKWGLLAALPIPGSGLTLDVQEVDGTPSGSYHTLKFSNGSMTDNLDGSATITTGTGGGGDVSSVASSSVDSEVALFSGTGGKTIKRATETGIPKLTAGVLSTAAAGTDYVLPSGNVATATALGTDGANCSAGQFAAGVSATGAAQGCAALPTTITGTANQIAASASTGAITLSIPTNPTLPGTTTGTFSGPLTGNASTATALTTNGTNCSAGNYPLGVDASGNAETCTPVPTAGHILQEEGTPLAARGNLNFVGAGVTCTDSGGTNSTVCTIAAGGSTMAVQEVDGTPSGTFNTLKFSNGSVTDNGDGSVTVITGVGGGGDVSSNTATSVDSEVALFSGAGGKTIKRATGTGLAKLTAGVLGVGTAGTDYVLPAGNVATATALTTNGTNCSAGQAAQGIDTGGNAEGCFTPPGGGGDVTGVGNCTGGDCLDGTSDGGTSISLYDGDSHKTTLQPANLTADRVHTLPDETGTLATRTYTESHPYPAVHVSTSGTVSAATEYVTTGAGGVTRTLPAAASGTTTRRFLILKEDAGASDLTLAPAGAHTLNGVTTPLTTSVQWSGFLVQETSATNWAVHPLVVTPVGIQGTPLAGYYARWVNARTLEAVEAPVNTGVPNALAFYSTPSALDETVGIRVDAGQILSVKERVTPMTTNVTLTDADGPIIACTAGASDKTATLPGAASTTQSRFLLVKVDSGSGACILAPMLGERINGTINGTKTATTQHAAIDARLISTSPANWHVISDKTAIDLSTDVTGTLAGSFVSAATETARGTVELATTPETTTGTDTTRAVTPAGLAGYSRVVSAYIPAGNFEVNGGCTLGSPAVLLTNGPKTVALTCTDATADSLETVLTMPDGWNAGTITVEVTAFNVGSNASTLVYEISWIAKCVGAGEAPGTWAAVTHATDPATTFSLTTTDNVLYHATSGAITPAGGCAAGDTLFLKGEIDASATTMTPMSDLKLLGVKVEYTRNAPD